ncbi:phosphoribosyltransferase family protein [Lentilactobacillus diolivorans]|uniref:phosphoribosyltransferase family protein n=1 Tax=Lentilactobacillus diolivorans TaxID=179838 RepID=UPI002468EF09|nr:phosphoribosyltransferase family protein [Lentilactobacillus diolivorans]MDH5105582.1 phosphoribosyltransferase family protein [Lentilactobacillus diolivorans]
MQSSYKLTIGKLKRTLPIIPINQTTAIASFVLLGDAELAHYAAIELTKRITKPFDYFVTIETKGIPLAEEMSRLAGRQHYVVLRKSEKLYMRNPMSIQVKSITTTNVQHLVLDATDADLIKGKRIILVDDVISTGGSLVAAEDLLNRAGASVIGRYAILAEGNAGNRKDCDYLAQLPLFSLADVETDLGQH